MQATNNNNNTTTVTTSNGSVTLPTNLWALFAACTSPTKVTALVAKARALGYSNGYVRSQVQQLAQPGQYKGSACIGAIITSTQGRSLLVQVAAPGQGPAPVRPKLTRRGSNTPAAQAAASANNSGQ